MLVESLRSKSGKHEPVIAWSLRTGTTLIRDQSSGIAAAGDEAVADTEPETSRLPWRYCALSMLGASALFYGMAYFAIAAIS